MKQQCESGASHYSTTEQFTGMYWIDGKKIYRKVIDFGALPNTTSKNKAHNISNLDSIITLKGMATNSPYYLPLPLTSIALAGQVKLEASSTNITITTGDDKRSYNGIVIIEYTKTT